MQRQYLDMMKTIGLFFILPALLLVFTGCSNNSDSIDSNENQPCHCIMDTLKGEWSWIKTYGSFFGKTTENEFKSTLRVYSQNEDASINYEIFSDDTLFYEGSFQIQENQWNREIVTINLPHNTYGDWIMYFENLEGTLEEPFLVFWDSAADGYMYYYQKIRKEK
jgi:hypothetical protein